MKFTKHLIIITLSILLVALSNSCKTHKDCKGRKKTAKTAMGGWL